MRLITWNCNQRFQHKHDFVAALQPDVLIVPECERISDITPPFGSNPVRSIVWSGDQPRKGLAVISYGDYILERHPNYDPQFKWIVPLMVSGPVEFLLFAVWTLPMGGQDGKYVRPLLEALAFYEKTMDLRNGVWAGDFNANYIWDTPRSRHKFSSFVSQLQGRGIQSVYHCQRGCEHGKETEQTHYHHYHAEKGYHIDYVFAPEAFHANSADVSIGSYAEWSKLSDHVPVVCEFLMDS